MLLIRNMVTPDSYGITKDNNANSLFNNSKSVRVPGMGQGELHRANLISIQLNS